MKNFEGIYFGPAGWVYSDWLGPVYPKPMPARFNQLAFLAGQFDFVEVNTTFYRIPALTLTRGWVNKTAEYPDFTFWIKLHQSFTHERKLELPLLADFKNSLQPLSEAGKLAGLLAQFPYSFKFEPSNLAFLQDLTGHFNTNPLAVEFRHQSWLKDEVSIFFKKNNLVWTNIDQPQIAASLPLTALVTGQDTAYLRLHGRNYQDWFSDQGRDARYNYFYDASELGRLAEVVASLKKQAKKIFISGNNHYKGAAVKNLLQLKEILLKRQKS